MFSRFKFLHSLKPPLKPNFFHGKPVVILNLMDQDEQDEFRDWLQGQVVPDHGDLELAYYKDYMDFKTWQNDVHSNKN